MKYSALVLSLATSLSAHAASKPLVSCEKIEIFDGTEYKPVRFTDIHVFQTAAGYEAQISVSGQSFSQTDVAVTLETPNSESGKRYREFASFLAPHVRWDDVAEIRVSNVGVKANREDAAGMMIIELFGKDGSTLANSTLANSTLAKMVTVGWSGGRCQ